MNAGTTFSSLVIPTSSHQDMENSSFVVLPSSSANDNDHLPVSMTTVPYTRVDHTKSGAFITELPIDQPDSVRSGSDGRSTVSHISSNNLGEYDSRNAIKNNLERQQSLDSTINGNLDTLSNVSSSKDNLSASTNSTLTKRQGAAAAAAKHSEVYV